MRVTDILSLLKEFLVLGGVALVVVGLAFFLGYKIIYQKCMKGQKRISKRKLVLYGATIMYAVIVFGAVFLSRGGFYGVTNLHLFSSYFEAYHKMEASLFRNIILNILLFVPFGFLLPHYSDKFKKIYIAVPIGFCVSLMIELIQYITKIGIFELDDIFNNTVGVWIGYGVYMVVYRLKHKEKRAYIPAYVLPIILTGGVFASILGIYNQQELGNLSFEANYRLPVKQAKIETEIELGTDQNVQPIYYVKTLTEEETRKKAEEIFSKLDTEISEDDIDIYENTAIYYSTKRRYNLWIDYRGGKCNFTDFSMFGEEKVEQKQGASKEEILNALSKMGIEVPETAEFQEGEGPYIFTIAMEERENILIDGNISVNYYEDGTIKKMSNNLVTYEKVAEKQVISPQEAYQEIQKGNFQYKIYMADKIQSIVVQDVQMKYSLDTKGYYVPYYEFTAKINGEEMPIAIKAIR